MFILSFSGGAGARRRRARAARFDGLRTGLPARVRYASSCRFSRGSGSDNTARTVAGKMGDLPGQQVVVDNRSGASGHIGLEITARSAPDGHTIVLMSATTAVNSVVQKLPFDLLRDFAPVAQMTSQPYGLTVNAGVPAKSVRESNMRKSRRMRASKSTSRFFTCTNSAPLYDTILRFDASNDSRSAAAT
jgi:Tripartite tricarboxylate transporter family receptor